jgi:hypothetical protein
VASAQVVFNAGHSHLGATHLQDSMRRLCQTSLLEDCERRNAGISG